MPSITLPSCLMVNGRTVGTNAAGNKLGFVTEFDCELQIDWWGEVDDEYGWELSAVVIEWDRPPQRHIITATSDPVLWPVLVRAFKDDELALSEKIMERIDEALSDELYEASR